MHDQDPTFEHVISQLDYPNGVPSSDGVIPFLDQELRPRSKYSISSEYPSLFGDFPGGSSLYIQKDGRVASHVALLVREFLHPCFRLRVGLIGSVATSSVFRGMGMASSLLKSAVSELRQKRCALAVLWSDQKEFYLPLGFHRAGREADLKFDPSSVPDFPEKARSFDSSKDVEALWRLYRRQEYRVDRSLEEMKRLTKIPDVKIYVLEKEGQIVSYIAIGKGADFTNYIHEWGGDLDSVSRTIASTQKQFYPKTPLVLIAPGGMDLKPVKQMARERWDGVVGLIKILDRAEVLRAYEAYLKSRNVNYSLQDQGQTLVLNDQKYPISTEKEFLKVIFGDETPSKNLTLPFFLWGFDSI